MSGANAQVGVDARHAMETAADIINNSYALDLPTAKNAGLAGLGNAKIKLIFADHQSDPQKGRAEAERLITQEKVSALIGCYLSSVSSTVSAVAERYGLPFLCADSSSPSLARRGLKFFFRPAAQDEMFSAAMFDFLDAQKAKGKKIETVGLFFEDTIFGTDSSNIQRKLAAERGYKLVADIKYKSNTPSLSVEVQQLKSADPDVLMPSSYITDAILLMRTMGELGYRPKNIVAQASGFSDKAFFDAVGDKAAGVISRASFSLDMAAKRQSVLKVNDMYKARSRRDLARAGGAARPRRRDRPRQIDRRREDPRGAGRDRHPRRAHHHAVETRQVRRRRTECRRRSRAGRRFWDLSLRRRRRHALHRHLGQCGLRASCR